jgi:hypothetical protein
MVLGEEGKKKYSHVSSSYFFPSFLAAYFDCLFFLQNRKEEQITTG